MRHLLIVPALLLAACGGASFASSDDGDAIDPAGSGGQRSYPASGFERIGLFGPDSATIEVGPAFSVRAEGDPAVLDRLQVKVKGDRLELGRKRESMGGGGGAARFVVTLPRLKAAAVAGSGNMAINKAEADEFKASIAGSGDLSIGALRTGLLDASIAGSGDFSASGTAEHLDASVAGSGNFDGAGLASTSAEVSIAGSGRVRARVNGQADVSIVGSGDAELGPQARCKVSRVGSGRAHCA